jgi:hypothetical protein
MPPPELTPNLKVSNPFASLSMTLPKKKDDSIEVEIIDGKTSAAATETKTKPLGKPPITFVMPPKKKSVSSVNK